MMLNTADRLSVWIIQLHKLMNTLAKAAHVIYDRIQDIGQYTIHHTA